MVRLPKRTALMNFWKRHKDRTDYPAPDIRQTTARAFRCQRKEVSHAMGYSPNIRNLIASGHAAPQIACQAV